MPRRIFPSVKASRCERNSTSRLSSPWPLRKKPARREPKMRMRLISRSFRAQQSRDDPGHALPAFRFGGELFPAGARQRVIFGLAIVVRNAPLRGDPPALLQPQQRRVQRALIQLQQVLGNLLDALRDAVAVQRPQRIERLQNDQVQGSLENLASRRGHVAAPLDEQQEANRLPVERQQETCPYRRRRPQKVSAKFDPHAAPALACPGQRVTSCVAKRELCAEARRFLLALRS